MIPMEMRIFYEFDSENSVRRGFLTWKLAVSDSNGNQFGVRNRAEEVSQGIEYVV